MGFLRRLLNLPDSCTLCGVRAALIPLRLPDGSLNRLCSSCKEIADAAFLHPIYDFEFGEMLDVLGITAEGVWGIPWGATRDVVVSSVPLSHKHTLAPSRSPSLIPCQSVSIAGRKLDITMILDETGHLDQVMISPTEAVLDAVTPMTKRFGTPTTQAPGSVDGELRLIWHHLGAELDLSYPPMKMANVIIRREPRWT